jgi:hypothetical protein
MKITVTILISFLFLACGSKPAEQIAFPTTCKAEDDKRYVQFSGYVTDGGSVFCSNTGGRMECGFELTEKPDGGAKINVDIAQGSGSSSVEKFEGSYKKEDIKIHDRSGGLVKLGDNIQVKGKMNALPDGSHCFFTVDEIEKQ